MSAPDRERIPISWIKSYTDKLLEIADKIPRQDSMGIMLRLRVEYVNDMIEAWRKHCEEEKEGRQS